MLIGFLGAPISGKTTTAARLFAGLKDNGYVAEFIPEQARVHIASMKYAAMKCAAMDEPFVLNDRDQQEIMARQEYMERIFTEGAPKHSFIITDATAFLALLYMTPEARASEKNLRLARASAAHFDLLFRCHPVHPGELYDPNRVHSFEQSKELDAKLVEVIDLVKPKARIIELAGPSHVRASFAHSETLEQFICQH